MNNRFFQRARKALAGPKTTFLVGACHAVAGGVLSLLAGGCALAASPGAPGWIPLAAVANEQATPMVMGETAKPTVAATAVAATAVAATADSASGSRMSTHAAAPTAWKTTPDGFAPLSYFAANCARCHGPNGSFYGDSFARARDDASLRQIVHDMAFGPAQAPIDEAKLEVLTAYHRSLIDKKPFLSLASATLDAAKTPAKTPLKSAPKPLPNQKPATNKSKSATTPAAKKPVSKTTNTKTIKAIPAKTQLPMSKTSGAAMLVLQGEATPGARVTVTQGSRRIEAQRKGDTWTAILPAASIPSPIEITATKDGVQTVLQSAKNSYSHFAATEEQKNNAR